MTCWKSSACGADKRCRRKFCLITYFLNIFDKFLPFFIFPSLEGNFLLTKRSGPGCSIRNWSKIFAFSSETDRGGCLIELAAQSVFIQSIFWKTYWKKYFLVNNMYVLYVLLIFFLFLFLFIAFLLYNFPILLGLIVLTPPPCTCMEKFWTEIFSGL